MSAISDCIFVYGSLLSTVAHPKGEQLRREAGLIGSATVRGRLYRVSWYPAVKLGGSAIVHGELYRMHMPSVTLAWLDEYEGITPGPSGVAASDEYERRAITVTLDQGDGDVEAWIYHYRRSIEGVPMVASGRWTG